MGIVVCVTMLLGVLMLVFQQQLLGQTNKNRVVKLVRSGVPFALLFLGAWNAAWYALSNFHSFWGKAALVSGSFMMVASLILMHEYQDVDKQLSRRGSAHFLSQFHKRLKPLRWVVVIGLSGSFLLYCITLVQLNLGYSIIR